MHDDPVFSEDQPIRLASRASPLAIAQTREVQTRLGPVISRIDTFSTRGDEVQDRSLAELGGKGLFVKTLEAALIRGDADAAVHSAKDMENHINDGTYMAAYLEREDRRDALIGPYADLSSLPKGAVIGTASVRRAAMLRAQRPDCKPRLLRGNVNSRLRQLNEGNYDAIILAMAGIKRLDLDIDYHPLDEEVFLPAACQGVIAIQARNDDTQRGHAIYTALTSLGHAPTTVEVQAERALLASLDGTCRTPIGASAHLKDGILKMKACLLNLDGSQCFEAEASASADDAMLLGSDIGKRLLDQAGGRAFIHAQKDGF
ncbi:hydroxymethylbilane synthase [Alphaproteobacteria bacterium LSUCC0684]